MKKTKILVSLSLVLLLIGNNTLLAMNEATEVSITGITQNTDTNETNQGKDEELVDNQADATESQEGPESNAEKDETSTDQEMISMTKIIPSKPIGTKDEELEDNDLVINEEKDLAINEEDFPLTTEVPLEETVETYAMTRANIEVGKTVVNANSTNGVNMNFLVMTVDHVKKTGTVEVGNGNKTGPNGHDTNGNGIVSVLNADKTLTIPGTIAVNHGTVDTPDIYTYTVVSIGAYALSDLAITELNLPSTLKTIEKNSLRRNNFVSLDIPEGVTRVGYMSLISCPNLKVVKFPTTITELGRGLFQNSTAITTVYFPVDKAKVFAEAGDEPNLSFHDLNPYNTVVIVNTDDQYRRWRTINNGIIPTGNAEALISREIPVEFYDRDLDKLDIPTITKLLGRSPAATKNDSTGEWTSTRATTWTDVPTLPSEEKLGYKANFWGINDIGIATVNPSGLIEGSNDRSTGATGYGYFQNFVDLSATPVGKLVAVEKKLEVIAAGFETAYTGKKYECQFSFNRTLKNDGFFNGTWWTFAKIYMSPDGTKQGSGYVYNAFPVLSGVTNTVPEYEKGFVNVADSGTYTFQLEIYDKWTNPASSYYLVWTTKPNDRTAVRKLTVKINPADISITPQTTTNIVWADQDALPEITVKATDTKGTITWDAGQTPMEGENGYTYTFVPDNLKASGVKGNDILNFTEEKKQGTIIITYGKTVPTPTPAPTAVPTVAPTAAPTAVPTVRPTVRPTVTPTVRPTVTPTVAPTTTPTATPESSWKPSVENKEEGVKVESVGNKDIFEKEEKIYLVDVEETIKKEVEQKLENIIKVFDILTEVDGVKVEKKYDSKIRITLDAKDYVQYKELKVYQKNSENQYIELSYEIVGDKIIFECDAFDTYVLTGIITEFPWWIVVVTISGLVAAIAMIFIIRKRRATPTSK